MKRFHWFEITLVVIIMAVHLYVAFSAPHNFSIRWFTRDDAFYYYKVAQSITEGHGSTFDGTNITNGYHPLWMLICLPIFALARFDLILPLRIILVIMAALSAATSVLLFRLLRKAVAEPVAILAASFWGLSTLIHSIVTQPGMETGITALSVVLMLYVLQKLDEKWRSGSITSKDMLGLTLVALFVAFSRLDSIYLALLAGIWIIFRRTPVRYFLPIDLLATFSIIVLAYIQRAGLDIYLGSYTNPAIIAAAVTFVVQSIVFYFAGLYRRPVDLSIAIILRQSLIGATVSAVVSGVILLGLSAINLVDLPRAVLLIYWIGILLVTLITRLVARAISPFDKLRASPSPVSPSNGTETALSQFRQNWKTWLREGLTYYGILGAALGTYMLLNKIIVGTPLPVSGQIKRWWGSLPNGVYGGGAKNILDIFAIDPYNSQAWSLFTNPVIDWASRSETHFWAFDRLYWIATGIMIGLWLFLFLRNRRKNLRRVFQTALIPLLVSAELQTLLYGAMGYAGAQEWYWTMQMIAIVILAAFVLSNLLELLPRRPIISTVTWVGTGAISLYFAFSFTTTIYNRMPYQDQWAGQPYMDMLPILEGYSEKGAIIGMTGGGNAGYFIKDRTIVNMDGLINSYAYFQALKDGKASQYLQNMGVKYVFGSYYILTETMPYRPSLEGHLQQIPAVPAYGRKELLRLIPKP
jgi:hypothetical protein